RPPGPGRARGDPVGQPFGAGAVRVEPVAAAVLERQGGFGEDQAVAGPDQVDAPALQLLDDRVEIRRRVAAEERQPEPAAPGRRPGTGAGVAAGFGQPRRAPGVEIDGPRRRRGGDGQEQERGHRLSPRSGSFFFGWSSGLAPPYSLAHLRRYSWALAV